MGRSISLIVLVAACSGDDGGGGGNPTPDELVTYGDAYEGGEFHLGPVDYEETQWHNACAPGTKYAPAIREVQGDFLVGLWGGIPNVASYCDACIYVETAMGKSALLRVVTYGDTTPNSIDVSPSAYAVLDSGEYPRAMTWRFAKCNDTGPLHYEFQTGSNPYWTSLWVRNARVPMTSVRVKSKNHGSYIDLARAGDGTVTDASGFGEGEFTMQLTGVDGQMVTDTFSWPSPGIAGQMLVGESNFR